MINSFGNNSRTFLYSKESSELKYKLANEIIENHDVFYGYKQTETYKKYVTQLSDNLRQLARLQQLVGLQQLERLQQLGRLQELEHLQQLERLQHLDVTNLSYTEFSHVKDAILYLDPPYENLTADWYGESFDSQAFYDWAYEMAKDNVVIISSYEISDERFKCVYSFDNVGSTMRGRNVVNKCEKLFMVREF